MKKSFVCICCPRGCLLEVEDGLVKGNQCLKGKKYGIEESSCPKRIITTLIRINNREDLMVSCKSTEAIEKSLINDVLKEISLMSVPAPIHIGDVLIKNILNTGIDIIATKNII